jgi:hypothetical protein
MGNWPAAQYSRRQIIPESLHRCLDFSSAQKFSKCERFESGHEFKFTEWRDDKGRTQGLDLMRSLP